MRHIIQQIETTQINVARHHDGCVSLAGLREAHESVKYADSVGRVTTLAFIFIPLSFVTSFFGMNVREFGTGDVQIWVVPAVAAGLALVIGLVWSFSRRFCRQVQELRTRLHCLGKNWHHMKSIAQVTPTGGLWLCCFAITQTQDNYEWLLWVLGMRTVELSET
jgi:CorA-like Mg2+ transporter protein